jgi:hypothetical protein
MAVGVVVEFAGATLEQYDDVVKNMMGFTPGGAGAPGCLFHWATKTENGIRVTDVWEAREQFEAFARDQIGPFGAKAGFPSEPQVTFCEVHNYLTAG